MTTINAGNFGDYLPLGYAGSLADGVTNIDVEESSIVGKLVDWSAARGYEISRDEAADVLRSCIENRLAVGDDE